MKGDFSRVTFDPRNRYSQVLQQQGRVTLDADPNEQGAILLHYLRTMARDLFGPYGGPVDHAGFRLSISAPTGSGQPRALLIGPGRYYVEGILCESDGCNYLRQPHYTPAVAGKQCRGDDLRTWLESREGNGGDRFWIYLDVWERHLTAIEQPSLREAALGGPDTCSRSQVVWQVKAMTLETIRETLRERLAQAWDRAKNARDEGERLRLERWINRLEAGIARLDEDPDGACAVPLDALRRIDLPELAARIDPGYRLDDPCVMSPESGYRGVENHLYRVEIHRGSNNGAQPTFKWSRDNGSVLSTWLSASGNRIRVGNVRGFTPGAWVELSHEQDDLLGNPGTLHRILGIDGDELELEDAPAWTGAPGPKARRWDQATRGDVMLDEGAVPVATGKGQQGGWIDLEDGVQVRFAPERDYRSGDYWLVPARVATGRLEWREDADGQALLQAPRGIRHHYAPLGFAGTGDDGTPSVTTSCTCTVYPLNTCGILGQRVREEVDRDGKLRSAGDPLAPGKDDPLVDRSPAGIDTLKAAVAGSARAGTPEAAAAGRANAATVTKAGNAAETKTETKAVAKAPAKATTKAATKVATKAAAKKAAAKPPK